MIDIIAPAFASHPVVIPSLLLQSDPNWRLKILHDGRNSEFLRLCEMYSDPRVTVGDTPQRGNCWGHNLRKLMLEEMSDDGDFVVITNHDNYFLPNFIQTIRGRNEEYLMWDILHNYFGYEPLHAKMQFGHIDISQVAVKKSIAKKIGWQSMENASDWPFMEACFQEAKNYLKINQILGIHN